MAITKKIMQVKCFVCFEGKMDVYNSSLLKKRVHLRRHTEIFFCCCFKPKKKKRERERHKKGGKGEEDNNKEKEKVK